MANVVKNERRKAHIFSDTMFKPTHAATRAGTRGHGKIILSYRRKSGMEEIQISKEQEQKLLSLFKKG